MKKDIYTLNLIKPIEEVVVDSCIARGDFAIKKYNKNVVLHFEREICDKVEIVISGKIVVERIDESGGIMVITEFVRGDIIGGNLIFSTNPYYPMTITTKQECSILQINKEVLFNMFTKYPEFLKTFLEYVSDHTYMLGDKIRHYINRTIRESLINFLKHERDAQNSNKIKLNMTKKELAEKIGVHRTSLSRELNKMKKDKIIDYNIDSITILKDL